MKKSSSNSSVASPSEIRSETKARDHELKVISERISCAERHFSILLKDFTAFSSGLISMQDKGMRISKSVDVYSDQEYPSLKASLAGVSENIAATQDLLGAQVEQDLQKLAADARRARQTLEYQMVEFERKKIQDIKTVFSCFFHGQMLFHAKALELYTAAFQNVFSMDEEQDIEAFQNDLHSTQSASRQDLNNTQTPINRFGSQGSLGSQMSLNKDGRSERGPDEDDSEISDFE
ncbi:PREDICTED: protein FAM92A1-like [Acropora digitifera]|uniref:protein FAM92A1-like n=1 Tax=Acropora digitifera TaxID=70779 RepID=UPI00077AE956|nr:PREDICTED: protein FAM92A1-like [Acropora digitifera]